MWALCAEPYRQRPRAISAATNKTATRNAEQRPELRLSASAKNCFQTEAGICAFAGLGGGGAVVGVEAEKLEWRPGTPPARLLCQDEQTQSVPCSAMSKLSGARLRRRETT